MFEFDEFDSGMLDESKQGQRWPTDAANGFLSHSKMKHVVAQSSVRKEIPPIEVEKKSNIEDDILSDDVGEKDNRY